MFYGTNSVPEANVRVNISQQHATCGSGFMAIYDIVIHDISSISLMHWQTVIVLVRNKMYHNFGFQ